MRVATAPREHPGFEQCLAAITPQGYDTSAALGAPVGHGP
ncbi:hypothetical protein HMPREF9005_2097 [Actinomyces sp. oral taxon 178 str. F0338]|nr:hypothetical protein HMPREF9005_2097 [Actinomyces sp. oral taxon 178 str. F0338]